MDALEPLRIWLNSKREYWQGVALFRMYGCDERRAAMYMKGPTDFTRDDIFRKLKEIYDARKPKQSTGLPGNDAASAEVVVCAPTIAPTEEQKLDPKIIEAFDIDAKKQWKHLMNRRAQLFGMIRNVPPHEDVNTPDRVRERTPLVFEIHQLARNADAAYDKLAYVRQYNKLPSTDDAQVAEEFAQVPDHSLKHVIDNIRKNLSKLRKREATPERIALITQHEATLARLIQRWNALKNIDV